ncbi:hypothetical protein [Undibacterium flavidum]|uniref:Metalloprotease with PDZ domain n=1 Tax=Undibacterium flavidum TaxID=2762297 RepID=A0ABR6Y9W5_9BURK|nr:hypothetical protein [Undibacterium flavidum]MBC3873359.1 hypothetical protein [Undibacterium flavidum]
MHLHKHGSGTLHSLTKLFLGMSLSVAASSVLAQVDIKLRFEAGQGLKVEYHLPPNCPQLKFEKDGPSAALIRVSWKADNECFVLDGDYLKARETPKAGSGSCRVATFSVPANINKVSGYPAAFPMGEFLYAHTSNYQVDTRCGDISYEMIAPNIAFEGQQVSTQARISPASEISFPVLFSSNPLVVEQGVLSYIDPTLSPPNVARIKEVSQKTISYLKDAMPKARFMMPIIAAAKLKHPGDIGFDGDAGNVLRLILFNWPDQVTPDTNTLITKFVAHEFSHRFQKRDEVDIYPISRVIHEGGGEYLRWYTSLKMGWMNQEEAANDLDDALNRCLLGTENKAWQTLSASYVGARQLEYRCGLAAYAFGLAARQNPAPAIHNFAEFYAHIQNGERPDFYDALECGKRLDCHPQWLPQLFASRTSMAEVWQEFVTATGLAHLTPPNQSQLDVMMKKAFGILMRDDCGGSSMFEASDGLIVDDLKTCKLLRKGMKIIGVEGHKIFGNANSLTAYLDACRARGKVKLQLAEGADVELECKTLYVPQKYFYAVDIKKLLQRLN